MPRLFRFLTSCLVAVALFSDSAKAQVSSNVTFRGQLSYANDLADIWGWRNPADGKEYALVGVTNGFSIVDVSVPTNPVQLHFVPGANTLWRDVKTWNNYAYVTNEGSGGLLIVDLSGLPGSISTSTWNGGVGFSTAHNVFIDENGIAYLCGSNGSLGTLFLDVDANPTNPPIVGSYTTRYVHDLYVRGDTMWTAEINNGIFSVVDVSNKAAPSVMATQSTTSNFTHNLWLSDDGQYLFTTDEVNGANVDSYDVSDLTDIRRLDTFRPGTGPGSIPHNTFVIGDFLVTAWYRDGLRVTDASRPDNMIEVGWYDTSPLSGSGFNGAWGVYPYLPSGNALVTDIEQGLFVLTPSYLGAAFLEGNVTDASSGAPLFNASVSIGGSSTSATTNIFGQYSTGLAGSGTFSVTVSRAGYVPQTISGVSLSPGATTTLNVALVPSTAFTLSGQVRDALSGSGIPAASIRLEGSGGVFNLSADASGNFSQSGLPGGVYDVYAGKWGYETELFAGLSLSTGSSPLNLDLTFGYTDDFVFDQGWTVSSTASTGAWVRAVPVGTSFSGVPANPGADLPDDLGNLCYVTGNGGGGAGTDDVDDGSTTLTSPVFDLSGGGDPVLNFARWFFNDGGSGAPNDSLIIRLSNGSSTATLEVVTALSAGNSSWIERSFRILDFLPLSATMQLIVTTADRPGSGHLVEAGFDGFSVSGALAPGGCAAPTGTAVSSITSTSARVSWAPVPGATGYQIQGRRAGTSTFRSITTGATARTVNNLNPGTSYEWQVRAQCSGGAISGFSPLSSFSTASLREAAAIGNLRAEPNPVQHSTRIVWEQAQDGTLVWQLSDNQGRMIRQGEWPALAGSNQVQLDLSDCAPGLYWLHSVQGTESVTAPIVRVE
jgi:choice-of-anchor B domain-containing protein